MLKKFFQDILWKFNYDLSKIHIDNPNFERLLFYLKPVNYQRGKLVRIGNQKGDGGYLIPNDFSDVKYLFSLGVGNEFSFEEDLFQRGIKVFMADYTVPKNKFKNLEYNFTQLFIKNYNSEKSLRFDDWKEACITDKSKHNIILQIDIEGDEYSVIPSIKKENLLITKFLIVEFHFLTRYFDKKFHNQINSCFERISEFFYPVHLHVNNTSNVFKKGKYEIPHTLEVTFANKIYFNDKIEFSKDFPNNLDRPCVASKKEIFLPKVFYE